MVSTERVPRRQGGGSEARIFLIAGALLCFGGSLYSVYVPW